MPNPYAEGRVREELALLDQREVQPDGARAQLETALAIFQRLGANKDVARIQQFLAEPPIS